MIENIIEKECRICNKTKPITEFHIRKDRAYIYYRTECKECISILRKEFRINNIDKEKQRAKKYRDANKDSIALKNKVWRKENNAYILNYHKNYHAKNKPSIKKQRKEFYEANKDRINETKKEWYKKNKDHHRERQKKYDKENKKQLQAARRKWENKRLDVDIEYKLQKNLRGRIRLAISKKIGGAGTVELLGCSISDLRVHIEKQFKDGMSWDNYGLGKGKWHIDHKIPISWFKLENDNCKKAACNYTNLQPLWGVENIRKGNKRADV